MLYHATLRQALDAVPSGGLYCTVVGGTVQVLATRIPCYVWPRYTRTIGDGYEWLSLNEVDSLAVLAEVKPAPGAINALCDAIRSMCDAFDAQVRQPCAVIA